MTEHGLVRRVCALLVVFVSLGASVVFGQTNARKTSAVGVWKVDLAASDFGSDPKPQSLTLTILTDNPDQASFRVDVMDAKKDKTSYHWSGPKDGTMHPVKDADGKTLAQESMRNEGDALIRHVEAPDGVEDARDTMSPDGNTITDESTQKGTDGKTSKSHVIYHRVSTRK